MTPEYVPVDLARYVNAGAGAIPTGRGLRGGPIDLLGLPFHIVTDDFGAPRVFAAQSDATRLAIAIGRTAVHVIFAQIVVDDVLDAGGPVGAPIATYRFCLADGDAIEVAIRERFEIGTVQSGMEMPHLPFAAMPDSRPILIPRTPRDWDTVGRLGSEVEDKGWPKPFTLWAWRNPRPSVSIDRLEVVALGRRFVIGAITLGLIDEPPFVRSSTAPLKVELLRAEDAARPFDLSIVVDRGIARTAYPLPRAEGIPAWGGPRNLSRSPAYAPVAALPSATVTLHAGDELLGAARWADVVAGPVMIADRARLELLDTGRNWVRTSVRDENGEVVPCRISFRSRDGVPYQPHGHHDHLYGGHATWNVDVGGDVRLGQHTYAYIDGTCEGWLPRGSVTVEAARGFEYEPLSARVEIAPGQRTLELRLNRRWDLRREGWVSGDTHVHFLSPQGAISEARGEDLSVVNLLQSQWGPLFTNTEDFSGAPITAQDGRTIVHVSQENRQHHLGHLALLGLRRPVMPWASDGAVEAEFGGTLETTLSHWADAAHEQGATVVIPHFPYPNGEHAALVATGRADAVEMIRHGTFNHLEYYRYLNAGFRLPLVGGTDKMSAEVPVGLYRTYVRIPPDEDFSHASWLRNLRAGRTFMSGGPLLRLSIDGAQIGDVIALPPGGGEVEVDVEALSIFPVHRLELIIGGQVAAATAERHGSSTLRIRERIRIDRSTWIAARVGAFDYAAPARHFDVWGRGIFAHTSPIYVDVGAERRSDRGGLEYMLTLVRGARHYVRHTATHDDPAKTTHHHGEADHLEFLERPLAEAELALTRRLDAASGR